MIVGAGMSEIRRTDQQVEIQVRVNVAILCLKFAEQASRYFYVSVLKQNCFFLWKPQSASS